MNIKKGDTIIFKESIIHSPDYVYEHFKDNPNREFEVTDFLENGRLIECLVPEHTGHEGMQNSPLRDRWNYETKYVLRKKVDNLLKEIKNLL